MTPERWQHIKEILQRALEQAPEKRPDFVAQACPGDASLQKEVESLLAAHQDSLDSPTLPVLEEGLGLLGWRLYHGPANRSLRG